LEVLASSSRFDVIFITETWYKEHFCPALDGYVLYSKSREDRNGGGVCIYVDQQLNSFEIMEPVLREKSVEQIWCGIKVGSETILAGCVYRPPGARENDTKIIQSISKSYDLYKKSDFSGVLLCGDFNCPKIDWGVGEYVSCPSDAMYLFEQNLIEVLDDCFYSQNVIDSAYQDSNGKPKSILDLVISENESRIYHIDHGPPLGSINKGHNTLAWSYEINSKIPAEKLSFRSNEFNYAKGDYNSFSRYLDEVNWEIEFEGLDINGLYDKFLTIYHSGCEKFIPKLQKTRRLKPWMCREIKEKVRKKKSAWESFKNSGWSVSKGHDYKRVKKDCEKEIKLAIKKYERNLAKKAKSNPKLVYKYLNSKRDANKSIKALLSESGSMATNPHDIANILNRYFSSVFVKDSGVDLPSIPKRTYVACDLSGEEMFSFSKVLERLSHLDPAKTIGVDRLHGKF
jgi:hypothetical protein